MDIFAAGDERRRDDTNRRLPPAPWPTTCLPGTVEKIQIFRWRVENGFAIFHPNDAKLKPDDDAPE